MTRVIGIDAGASGALVWTEGGKWVMHPTAKCSPIEAIQDAIAGAESVVAYLERIGGFIAGKGLPGSSMFKMGDNFGFWRGALEALQVRTILVAPQTWQKGLPYLDGKKGAERKRALRNEAKRRFPALPGITLDTCDALLIADYGVRQIGYERFIETIGGVA